MVYISGIFLCVRDPCSPVGNKEDNNGDAFSTKVARKGNQNACDRILLCSSGSIESSKTQFYFQQGASHLLQW